MSESHQKHEIQSFNGLWLGQAPASPFQRDQTLTSNISHYDGDSAYGRWPTFFCTKGHRLHDIKTLCNACNRIDIAKLTNGGPPLNLRDNYKDIAKTAKGCRFCSLLAQYTRGTNSAAPYAAQQDFCYALGSHDAPDGGPVILDLHNGKLNARVPYPEDWPKPQPGFNGWDLGSFDLSIPTDAHPISEMDDLTAGNESHPFSINASQLLEKLQRELCRTQRIAPCEVCLPSRITANPTGYQWLSRDEIPALPDRVLEILDSPDSRSIKLRLQLTGGSRTGNYIALSHRWGGNNTLTTTKSTLADRQKGFHLEDLPRTFQDAVLVTQALDIKYLWIDSLCIVQDDRDEWLEQSAKMGSIYMNSAFTIAAHSAAQCNEGFLWRSQISPTLRISPNQGGPEFLLGLSDIDPEQLRTRLAESEISHRAWILQELTLSPRILHFVEDRLIWECEHQASLMRDPGRETTAAIFRNASAFPEIQTMWLELVSRYTDHQMTRSGDKLVALAGVVEVLLKRLGDKTSAEEVHHHCGVFQQDIERSLLWYRAGEYRCKKYLERAPSWSWASVDGRLRFLYLDVGSIPRTLAKVKGAQHEDFLAKSASQHRCRIMIEAPVIRLTANLVMVKRKRLFNTPPNAPRWMTVIADEFQHRTAHGWCIPDEVLAHEVPWPMVPRQRSGITLVVISGLEVDGNIVGAWCIVVEPELGHGAYRRIGLGYVRNLVLTPALTAPELVTLI